MPELRLPVMDEEEFPRPAPDPDIKPKKSSPWSFHGLMTSSLPEPEFFFEGGVFARKTVGLISARKGTGKTYASLWLASLIATGQPFGPVQTRKGHVLYLSQEMGDTAIKHRLLRLFSVEEAAQFVENTTIYFKLRWSIDSTASLKALKEVMWGQGVENFKPYDVVIVDTLRDIKGKCRESDNDEMGAAFVRFRDEICEQFNVAGIMLHHKGKPGSDGEDRGSRGASAMEDVAADVIYLDKDNDSEKRHWTFKKTRDGVICGKTLDMSMDGNEAGSDRVTLYVNEGVESAEANFELRKFYSLMEQDGRASFTKADICKIMSWATRTAEKYIKLARDAGRLINLTKPPAEALYRYIPLAE